MSCRGEALDTEIAIPLVDNGRNVQILVGIDASDDVRRFGVFGHVVV
ncbi:hypothetical protein AB0T83_01560 [Fluviibacterium sp. DFM31]|uniref:Transposase n=1 Tax=Meridianimarinicoccus marinus TaxID=3231483 RepID=A0ABV3L1N2_9RHOB